MELKVLPTVLVVLLQLVYGEENVARWTPWTEWSGCSLSCGSGIISRTREMLPPAGSPPSEKPMRETQNYICNERRCPVDGKWTEWGRWLECSEACGGGITKRIRTCTTPTNGGEPCEGEAYEEDECNRIPCPPLPVRFNMSTCVTGKTFTCSSGKMCIPISEFCDQTVQCHDGSDEKRCYDVNVGGSGHYSHVREAGADVRASSLLVVSLVTMVIFTRLLG